MQAVADVCTGHRQQWRKGQWLCKSCQVPVRWAAHHGWVHMERKDNVVLVLADPVADNAYVYDLLGDTQAQAY
jgi:hypothetical protein